MYHSTPPSFKRKDLPNVLPPSTQLQLFKQIVEKLIVFVMRIDSLRQLGVLLLIRVATS